MQISKNKKEKGLYRLRLFGEVVYVGKSFKDCRRRLRRHKYAYNSYEVIPLPTLSNEDILKAESALIAFHDIPEYNDYSSWQGSKAEAEDYLIEIGVL